MWGTNVWQNIAMEGGRPLGDFTEDNRELQLVYSIAAQLGGNANDIFARIDVPAKTYEVAKGDLTTATLYGLEPYIVANSMSPTSLIQTKSDTELMASLPKAPREVLRSILKQILKES